MRHDSNPSRWGITVGLVILAAFAVAAAPRLRPAPPEPETTVAPADLAPAADLCVSIGQVECCYKEPEK